MTDKLNVLEHRTEESVTLMLAIDVQTEKLQTMIYHWVNDWSNNLKEFLKGKTPEDLERRLSDFHPPMPRFLSNPDYGNMIDATYIAAEGLEITGGCSESSSLISEG